MYFEIWKNDSLIKRGTKTLNELSWDNELMVAPSTNLTLPIEHLDYLDGREEIKIFVNDKIFWGIVWGIEVDKDAETIDLDLRHVITEWEYRQISVNNAMSNKELNIVYKGDEVTENTSQDEAITASEFSCSLSTAKKLNLSTIIAKTHASAWKISNGDKVAITKYTLYKTEDNKDTEISQITEDGDYKVKLSTAKGTSVTVGINASSDYEAEYSTLDDESVIDNLEDIYTDENFVYAGWQVEFQDGADEMIDYVYSRQSKLEALTQTMELTADLFWRVGFDVNHKVVEIGSFGEKKPYVISTKPSGESNIHIINEPRIEYDFENVINVATVYSDKSDSGMSSLTLREVYVDQSLQKDGFPVVILRADVNNERDYSKYGTPDAQPEKLASNNYYEYAILDEESIALESGKLIEGTYAFNDLSPFEIEGNSIPDEKRIKAAKQVYEAVVKKLIQARRNYSYVVDVEEIPPDLKPGDKVRFLYDNLMYELGECSSYYKKILQMDDYFYITRIEYNIDDIGNEVDTVTLSKWIRIERETSNE